MEPDQTLGAENKNLEVLMNPGRLLAANKKTSVYEEIPRLEVVVLVASLTVEAVVVPPGLTRPDLEYKKQIFGLTYGPLIFWKIRWRKVDSGMNKVLFARMPTAECVCAKAAITTAPPIIPAMIAPIVPTRNIKILWPHQNTFTKSGPAGRTPSAPLLPLLPDHPQAAPQQETALVVGLVNRNSLTIGNQTR